MDPHAATELIQTAAAVAAVGRLIYLNLAEAVSGAYWLPRFPGRDQFGFRPAESGFRRLFLQLRCPRAAKVRPRRDCRPGIICPDVSQLSRYSNGWPLGNVRWSRTCAGDFPPGDSHFLEQGVPGRSAGVFYVEVSQRLVVFTLAFVICAILLFLSRYPLHLSGNTLVSSACFSVLFLSDACRLLIDSLELHLYNPYVDWSEAAVISICLLGWATLLRSEVNKPVPERITFSTPREDHLLQQLNALNQMVTRSARR